MTVANIVNPLSLGRWIKILLLLAYMLTIVTMCHTILPIFFILFFTKFGTFSCMRAFILALWSYYCLNIPYSGKLSREKMFANFAVL